MYKTQVHRSEQFCPSVEELEVTFEIERWMGNKDKVVTTETEKEKTFKI
jgi:hypothetical protein